jgi:hypothetical protein
MPANYAFITIAEGSYFDGVVALLNSVIKSGFTGNFHVFYRGDLPEWTRSLSEVSPSTYQVGENKVIFRLSKFPHHLRFSKPASMMEVLEEDPELDGIFYADPDVTLLAPWSFFESWIEQGVTVCLDSNFPWIHERHPWRASWAKLIAESGLNVVSKRREYANSGFVGIPRSQVQVLENWGKLVETYVKSGADVTTFKKESRIAPVAGDQDLLMATLSTIEEEPSFLGRDGMGFNDHFMVMSHAVARIKPWDRRFVWTALKGDKARETNLHWLENLREPVEGISKLRWYTKMLDYKASLLISRFWRR